MQINSHNSNSFYYVDSCCICGHYNNHTEHSCTVSDNLNLVSIILKLNIIKPCLILMSFFFYKLGSCAVDKVVLVIGQLFTDRLHLLMFCIRHFCQHLPAQVFFHQFNECFDNWDGHCIFLRYVHIPVSNVQLTDEKNQYFQSYFSNQNTYIIYSDFNIFAINRVWGKHYTLVKNVIYKMMTTWLIFGKCIIIAGIPDSYT